MNTAIDHWSSVLGITLAVVACLSLGIYEALGSAVLGDGDALRAWPLLTIGGVSSAALLVIIVVRFLAAA